jgi:hypothetical protein
LEAGEVDFPPYVYSEGCNMRPSLITARCLLLAPPLRLV